MGAVWAASPITRLTDTFGIGDIHSLQSLSRKRTEWLYLDISIFSLPSTFLHSAFLNRIDASSPSLFASDPQVEQTTYSVPKIKTETSLFKGAIGFYGKRQ